MIPFLDLKGQFASIREEVLSEVLDALDSAQYILGPKVQAFEEAFAQYCNTRYAIGVNNGTSALHMALVAADIGPGDEVITTPMTFMATTAAILYAGATPVFADIDPQTCNIEPQNIEQLITKRTKAILPVHLYGQMADMPRICELAKKHGLLVIEDAAQAHGAEWSGKRAGYWGDMACFSFYPGKNLGACGEAGAVTTSDEKLAERLRMHRDWGQQGKYNHVLAGFNTRMEGIQGAVLGVKLRHLEKWTERRREIAAIYNRELFGLPGLTLPTEAAESRHVYHVYSVRTATRTALQQKLQDAGIGTGIHYPHIVPKLACYADMPFAQGSWPIAEQCAAQTLSLPMCPMLEDEDVVRVCSVIKEL